MNRIGVLLLAMALGGCFTRDDYAKLVKDSAVCSAPDCRALTNPHCGADGLCTAE